MVLRQGKISRRVLAMVFKSARHKRHVKIAAAAFNRGCFFLSYKPGRPSTNEVNEPVRRGDGPMGSAVVIQAVGQRTTNPCSHQVKVLRLCSLISTGKSENNKDLPRRRSIMRTCRVAVVAKSVLILFAVVVVAQVASAFPSWMGVYGSFVRHNDGSNPGTFTVLMNQDYFGLHANVGIQVNGGIYTEYSMSYVTNVAGNSEWTFTPGSAYSPGAVVEYYFHGYDEFSSSTIYDSNNASNYYFTVASTSSSPLVTSWATANSGLYARIRTNTAGAVMTTWSSQTLPAYSDVQTISSSSSNVYVSAAGLTSYIMGPWYLDAGKTTLFPNQPKNQKATMRFPLVPLNGSAHSSTSLGAIGMYVNGVAVFNMLDAFSYVNSSGSDSTSGDGIWNRDAEFGEVVTFDPANAHQPGNGQYHNHINPIGLRYQLGDNALYNAASYSYSETTNSLHHSPIVGWAFDGYPIYGPYGYSSATDPNSGVRRMISGYVRRNGQYGTANLDSTGRITLPLWAQAAQNRTTLSSSQYCPSTSKAADSAGSFAIGRYAEDNDFLGDLPTNSTAGAQWDLDRYNGRYCVTPDYPNGIYAYFVAINADGSPAFPYLIGRQYYGFVSGAQLTGGITESVTTNYSGGPNTPPVMQSANGSDGTDLVLTWSSVDGGKYEVQTSTDLNSWSSLTTNVSSSALLSSFTHTNALVTSAQRFYRAHLSSLAAYDGSTSTGSGILSVSPTSGTRGGSAFTLTINLDPNANPPPQNAPVLSVTVGSIAGTSLNHVSSTQVSASITIPANAATGPQTVTVVFPGPPQNPTQTVTNTLINGFTIQ